MKVKDNSVQCKFHHILTDFLFWVDDLYRNYGDELIITSGSEDSARHSKTSLHYATPGQAADVRIWQRANVPSPDTQRSDIQHQAKLYCQGNGIPEDWIEVILETTHIHIEYQPKRRD